MQQQLGLELSVVSVILLVTANKITGKINEESVYRRKSMKTKKFTGDRIFDFVNVTVILLITIIILVRF